MVQPVSSPFSLYQLRTFLNHEFKPPGIFLKLVVALITGGSGLLIAIAFAVLIFSGELSEYRAAGIGLAIFSVVMLRSVVAITSSFPGAIANIDALPAVILATGAGIIREQMAGAPSEDIFWTIVATSTCATLTTGVVCLLMGRFKIGGLIRFIPYPVIGGFLASTGWLLVQGSVCVMADYPLSWNHLPQFLEPELLYHWLPGALLGIILFLSAKRWHQVLVIPSLLAIAFGVYHFGLQLAHLSLAQAQADGWLLGHLAVGYPWQPLGWKTLPHVHWSVVITQFNSIVTIALIGAASILLIISRLSLIKEQDIEINHELEAAGWANILCSLGSGMVGYHELSDSILIHKLSARSRLVGLLSAGFTLLVLGVGSNLIALIPIPLLGGILCFLGLHFLAEWVIQKRKQLPLADYGIVWLILIVIASAGFIEGVAVGLVVATILFVVNYSQIRITRSVLTGVNFRSNVQRSPEQEKGLGAAGEQTYILKLQGFIFFGTANHLLNQIRQHLEHPLSKEDTRIELQRFVILDFQYVTGVDSSAILSFVKLKQVASKNNCQILFTSVSKEIALLLKQGGCLSPNDEICQQFDNLDMGVEWCENQLLGQMQMDDERLPKLAEQLQQLFLAPEQLPAFMKYLTYLEFIQGDVIFRQGDPADCLYFLESGQVSVILEQLPGKPVQRLRTFRSGTILGEMGVYSDVPRSASVIVDAPSRLYALSRQALRKMETDNLVLAASFHKFIVQLLTDRLKYREKELESLL